MKSFPGRPAAPELESEPSTIRVPRLLRRSEVAEILRISDRTLRKLLRSGLLPGIRIGASFRYRADDVARLIQVGWPGS